MTVLDAAVVTPGIIDAHTTVGLSGLFNNPADQDQLERSEQIQPELRAVDAYNPREGLVEWVRGLGVTTIHTGHGPGTIVSGQTLITKTTEGPIDEVVLVPQAMVAATLGRGTLVDEEGKSPGTRPKAMAMLRGEFVAAKTYRDKLATGGDKAPDRNLRLEALASILDGERPLMITVHRHHDILAALRLADEFDIPIVLDGCAEAPLVLDEIRAAGVSVILHPTMMRAGGLWDLAETRNASLETAAKLQRAGIPFALQSGFESYVPKTRVVLFEAGVAAGHGLPFEQALAAITIDAARLLGIADRVGSLEIGKDGDVALYDGDPLEYTSHCIGTVIDGRIVSDIVR
jgi:imidazolonepropionase-like amidohydrolase